MNLLDLVVGKPIKTSDERAEQIGPAEGIPIFGLDALSSAAYGPEAALSLLIPLGILGVQYIIPISAAIIALLVIVYFSYRQTIAAYPSGSGCAPGRLHPHRRGGHFGRSRRVGIGGSVPSATHGGDLRRHIGRNHDP